MPVRVLNLIKGLGPGGAEQLLVNQANAERSGAVEYHAAYLIPWKNHRVPQLEAAGWCVHELRGRRIWNPAWMLRLRRLIVDQRIDVVHGHSPLVAGVSRVLLRSIRQGVRPRSMYTEHNEWQRHRPGTRRLNRWTIALEDQVIAVSDAVRGSMPQHLEVEILIHGIDVDAVASQQVHRDAVRAELGIARNEIVIGTVANFRREKAYDVLLDAAARVLAERDNVRFVSVGQGPLEAEVRAQHESLGLGDRFLLLGYREDATKVMSAFDIFTLASRHEGLPVSLMEALALGLPVVATNVGGIPDAVRGGVAWLVTPSSASELVDGYESAVDAAILGPTQGARAPRLEFSAAEAASRLVEVYRVLGGRGAPGHTGATSGL